MKDEENLIENNTTPNLALNSSNKNEDVELD